MKVKLTPGTRSGVVCRSCGQVGDVRVLRGEVARGAVRVEDGIPHSNTCFMYAGKVQPKHLGDSHKWEKQEKRANALVGARATLASGAVNLDGDGRAFQEWRVESKQTRKSSFLLTQAVWEKLVTGAESVGEEPLLHVELDIDGNMARRVVVRKSWYMERNPREFLTVEDRNRNKKSYKVSASLETPHLIQLYPPGVMLYESEFSESKSRGSI